MTTTPPDQQSAEGGLKMAAKHTPGPWVIRKERVATGFGLMVGRADPGKRYTIAHVFKTINVSPETIEADARLIATSPTLLAALKKAERFILNGIEFGFIRLPEPGDPALDTLAEIQAAIRQAEGAA